ncbi:GNAT family N-acetyltransferase [Rhodoligotrophos defluvii]|uniref:GNAT family N-acetyltransferase n=1 Tax=Rhodoligotrophos defluvii TaxID=2561934 RepID=UPI0010C9AEAA
MGEITSLNPKRGRPSITPPAPINGEHSLDQFFCGKEPLDDWLRNTARGSEGKTARTYVTCVGQRVIGYYCLATGAVVRSSMPRNYRHGNPDPVPIMLIGRLAVDRHFQGNGVGKALLKDAFLRIVEASSIVGARAIIVHAIDEGAAVFYTNFGFIPFPDNPTTYMLPIEAIRSSLT